MRLIEAEWPACTDLSRMFSVLPADFSPRKIRLFAVAYCRLAWHLLANEQCRNAVEVSERFADGLAGSVELTTAVEAARRTMPRATRIDFSWDDYAGYLTAICASGLPLTKFAHGAEYARVLAPRAVSQELQCDLLRCIAGSPFCPLAVQVPWLTPTVVELAQTAYEERAFQLLPVLADALEEAGCGNEDVLMHCRGPGPHARGCWVLDLLTGRE
jgi:hypothetical protein